MNTTQKIISIILVAILFSMLVVPCINANVLQTEKTADEDQKNNLTISSNIQRVYIKVEYLEMHDLVDPDFSWDFWNKKADFFWKMQVPGGVDNGGDDYWERHLNNDCKKLEGSQILKAEHYWDVNIESKNTIKVNIELWDDDDLPDPWDDLLDINGALYNGEDESKIVGFTYNLKTNKADVSGTGGEQKEDGVIEFCGEWDGTEGDSAGNDDDDATMKIRIWDDYKLPKLCSAGEIKGTNLKELSRTSVGQDIMIWNGGEPGSGVYWGCDPGRLYGDWDVYPGSGWLQEDDSPVYLEIWVELPLGAGDWDGDLRIYNVDDPDNDYVDIPIHITVQKSKQTSNHLSLGLLERFPMLAELLNHLILNS